MALKDTDPEAHALLVALARAWRDGFVNDAEKTAARAFLAREKEQRFTRCHVHDDGDGDLECVCYKPGGRHYRAASPDPAPKERTAEEVLAEASLRLKGQWGDKETRALIPGSEARLIATFAAGDIDTALTLLRKTHQGMTCVEIERELSARRERVERAIARCRHIGRLSNIEWRAWECNEIADILEGREP